MARILAQYSGWRTDVSAMFRRTDVSAVFRLTDVSAAFRQTDVSGAVAEGFRRRSSSHSRQGRE